MRPSSLPKREPMTRSSAPRQRAEHETARLDPGYSFGTCLARGLGEQRHRGRKAGAVADQRGDVTEQDAGLRKVRHRADQGFQIISGHDWFPENKRPSHPEMEGRWLAKFWADQCFSFAQTLR